MQGWCHRLRQRQQCRQSWAAAACPSYSWCWIRLAPQAGWQLRWLRAGCWRRLWQRCRQSWLICQLATQQSSTRWVLVQPLLSWGWRCF